MLFFVSVDMLVFSYTQCLTHVTVNEHTDSSNNGK